MNLDAFTTNRRLAFQNIKQQIYDTSDQSKHYNKINVATYAWICIAVKSTKYPKASSVWQ